MTQTRTMYSIAEFCAAHDACQEGREWAIANCTSMQEAWDTAKPEWLFWIATRRGVLTERECRKLAVRIARTVQHLMADPRSLTALDVADRHADGLATDHELAAAWDAAWDAARAAAYVARAAASDATWAAARAARAAASDATWAATRAASAAAAYAARAAARADYSAIVRDYTPSFAKPE